MWLCLILADSDLRFQIMTLSQINLALIQSIKIIFNQVHHFNRGINHQIVSKQTWIHLEKIQWFSLDQPMEKAAMKIQERILTMKKYQQFQKVQREDQDVHYLTNKYQEI
jgi:hypothetical protein